MGTLGFRVRLGARLRLRLRLRAEHLGYELGVLVLEHGHLVPTRLEVSPDDLDDAPVVLRGLYEVSKWVSRYMGE